MERWHSMTARQVMEKLDSGPEGLSDGEAARRLERDGPNQLDPPRRPPLLLRRGCLWRPAGAGTGWTGPSS